MSEVMFVNFYYNIIIMYYNYMYTCTHIILIYIEITHTNEHKCMHTQIHTHPYTHMQSLILMYMYYGSSE